MEYAAVVAALGTGLRRVCSKGKTTLPPTARKWIGTPRYATLKTYSVIQKSQISEMITDQYNDGSTLYTLCLTGQFRILANHRPGTLYSLCLIPDFVFRHQHLIVQLVSKITGQSRIRPITSSISYGSILWSPRLIGQSRVSANHKPVFRRSALHSLRLPGTSRTSNNHELVFRQQYSVQSASV
jgi:hypothetical protein